MTHHDIITRIDFINRDTSVEKASIAILSPFVENDERWGLWSGISTRPGNAGLNKDALYKNSPKDRHRPKKETNVNTRRLQTNKTL